MRKTPRTEVREKSKARRNYLRELASPGSLSLGVTLFYLPFGLLGPVFIDSNRLGGSMGLWILIGLFGQLVLMGVIFAGAWLIRRISKIRVRASLTFLIFIVATSARGVTLAFIVDALGYTDMPELRYRLLSAVFPQTLTLLVVALAADHFRQNKQLVDGLTNETSRLIQLESSARTQVAAYRENLVREIRETVDPLVVKLRKVLPSTRGGLDQSDIQELSIAIDSQLRPMSEHLSRVVKPMRLNKPATPKSWSLKFVFPANLSLGVALSPLASGFFIMLSAISQTSRGLSPLEGWVFVLVAGFGMALIVGFFRWALGRFSPAFALSVVISASVNATSAALVISFQSVIGLAAPSFLLGPAIGIGSLIGLFTSVYQGMNQRQSELEELLASANHAYRANLSLLRQQMWVVRRNLGILVHGSLQSALRASILKIQKATVVSGSLLLDVQSEVQRAVALLDRDNVKPPEIERLFADLASTWQGVLAIEIQVSDATKMLLNQDDGCRWCVYEIALEAAHNAVVHGRANQAFMKVDAEVGKVTVCVTDNGSGLSPSATPGAGSQMFDEICVEWKRWQEGDKTFLQATLPIEDALECRSDRPIAAKAER